MKQGFDNKKYLKMQRDAIEKRIKESGNKLYLEFGGKLFDDYHASRVLPGFNPTSKIELLSKMKEKLEVIFCINANDIEKNKIRSDFGITYDLDLMRIIDKLREIKIEVNSVVITQFTGQPSASIFQKKLERRNIKTYIHTYTKGYPTDIDTIVSDEGYGVNSYIETTKPLIIVAAPGPGSGKLATCLSQLYHEHKRGIKAGYSKYETFPVWNLALKHPINIAYEAATADLKDVNMIDSFHLEAYKVSAVNYNRDLEMFPVLKAILEKITGKSVYKSPTDMGVNVIASCIKNMEVVKKASRLEIVRRYYKSLCDYKNGGVDEEVPNRIKLLMNELNLTSDERKVIKKANDKTEASGYPAIALELSNGKIITGRDNDVMTASASVVINAIKFLTGIADEIHLLSPTVLGPMLKSKEDLYENDKYLLNLQDVLLGLSICAVTNPMIDVALSKLPKLRGLDAHSSFLIPPVDEAMFRILKINLTSEAKFYSDNLYFE